jgi:hypothetical protein
VIPPLEELDPASQAWIRRQLEMARPLSPQQRAVLAALFDQAEDEVGAADG